MDRAWTQRVLLIAALATCISQAAALSVTGRAVQKDGSNPSGSCHATLQKEIDRRGAPDPHLGRSPDGKTSFSVPLNQSGYFQFAGVIPGKYTLSVECPAASGVLEVLVLAGSDARINPPLLLEELTLEIAVTPKVDPAGRPWQLTVDATIPRLRRIADKATITADGSWARRGLTTGNYRVTVSSSNSTPWLQRFFDLSAGSGPLLLRLPFMRVSGEVHLNSQPVRARLVFHNEAAGEPATLTSDDNGFFQGMLPVTPEAQETRWTVEARAAQPPISRRLAGVSVRSADEKSAWLDLALPVFAVHGTVVSNAGKPLSGVQVTFEDTSNGVRTTTATDDAGGFEQPDLPPGKYTAVAESIEGVSERTLLQMVDGVESELKLVLNPSERVSFSVLSSQGPVAEAAVQVWIQPGVPWWFTHTDADGRFEVKLPPGTTEVGLTVGARGYALKLTRLQISRESDESPNVNSITIDESGATLVLDLQPPGRILDSSMTPYLVHNGAIEAVGTLVGWAANQADASGRGPTLVETMEPGVYSLCVVRDPLELVAFWFGSLRSDSCRTGSVDQGGKMTLSPR
jgi:hypothetical protein